MLRLNASGTKLLKFFHIMFSIFWAGANFQFFIGSIVCKYQDESFIIGMVNGIEIYDTYIIIPSMLGLLITGLIYSIFTAWGFKKYYWIIIKWIMTIAFIYIASNVSNKLTDKLRIIVSGNDFAKNDSEFLAVLLDIQQLYGVMIFMIMVIVLVSVFKPFGKIKNGRKNNNNAVRANII